MSLERVIGGNACGLVCLRFGGIADVRYAQIDVAAFVGRKIRGAVRKIIGIRIVVLESIRSGLLNGIPIGVRLPVNRMAGRRYVCLVEGYGDHLMAPDIANVADVHGDIVPWLP